MVSHCGVVVSFAMREEKETNKIFYNVLDMADSGNNNDVNDRDHWLKTPREVIFPNELTQSGYSLVPNQRIPFYNRNNKKIIDHTDASG